MAGDSDRDSQMQVSSSSDAGDSDMFPTANDPPVTATQTSRDGPALNLMTSELSPPHSQESLQQNGNLNQQVAMDVAGSHDMVAEHGIRLPSIATMQDQRSDFTKSVETVQEPGAAWNNKKARDEWQRAYNSLEDKQFSLKDFGDPFDETQGTGNNRR